MPCMASMPGGVQPEGVPTQLIWREDHQSLLEQQAGRVSDGLAEADQAAIPETLAALLGPARAAVLVLLNTPKSTTPAGGADGPGTGISGDVTSRSCSMPIWWGGGGGRSVLYHRTTVGQNLVETQRN